jgi:hypothetical protein
MASQKMTLAQLVDILGILWKMFFGGEVAYDEVSCETAQGIVKGDHKWVARQFVSFLANGCRFVCGGLKIVTASFSPAECIGGEWSFWKGDQKGNGKEGDEARDKASLSLTEVDFEKVDFLTCLETGESRIVGEKKLERLQGLGRTIYGTTVGWGLWLDYQQNGAQSVLEKLYQQKGITYIDFFGDVLRSPGGNRYVLYLSRRGGGSWRWASCWLGNDWSARSFTAVSQQVSSL